VTSRSVAEVAHFFPTGVTSAIRMQYRGRSFTSSRSQLIVPSAIENTCMVVGGRLTRAPIPIEARDIFLLAPPMNLPRSLSIICVGPCWLHVTCCTREPKRSSDYFVCTSGLQILKNWHRL